MISVFVFSSKDLFIKTRVFHSSLVKEKLLSTLLFWWIAFSFEKWEHSQYIECKGYFLGGRIKKKRTSRSHTVLCQKYTWQDDHDDQEKAMSSFPTSLSNHLGFHQRLGGRVPSQNTTLTSNFPMSGIDFSNVWNWNPTSINSGWLKNDLCNVFRRQKTPLQKKLVLEASKNVWYFRFTFNTTTNRIQ